MKNLDNRLLGNKHGIVSEFVVAGRSDGLLVGRRFFAKDLFDIQGYVTGGGSPDWSKTHSPATSTAKCVSQLLEAGATLVGKTLTDEFAFGMHGINEHYGIPINPQFPDCLPGGSSSGSASTVASKLADFALGSDTGGSVRIPASYCGIYGYRPSHGAVAADGVMPLAPSLDTVGWFAREPRLLKDIGSVLLGNQPKRQRFTKIVIAEDAFVSAEANLQATFELALSRFSISAKIKLNDLDWQDCLTHFRFIQGWEAWKCYGEWIASTSPKLDSQVKQRFEFASTVSEEQYRISSEFRTQLSKALDQILQEDTLLCMPTTGSLPLPIKASGEELLTDRKNTLHYTCLASLTSVPQVTVPVPLSYDRTKSVGLSFLAKRGLDLDLLEWICTLQAGG